MSLKSFHLVFIAVSSLFMIYFFYWSFSHWLSYSDNSYLVYGILSVLSLLCLVLYSKKFINKYKGLVS